MDFLKAILGDDLYSQVETKVNAYNADEANKDKQVKIGKAVYVYDDHLRIVCNFTGDAGSVSYDFVNDIENYEEAVEVFDFDAHASTKR